MTITSVVELSVTKRTLMIWNSSEIPVQASLLSNYSLECANYALDDSPIEAEALDLLDTRFKAIPSLKEVIVNVHVYGEEDLSDDLMKKMRDCGWTVEVTKLEIPKKFGSVMRADSNLTMKRIIKSI